MKTWTNWEIGATYKRKSDGVIVRAINEHETYDHEICKHILAYELCYVCTGKLVKLSCNAVPSDFLLVDIETKTIGVRRKSDGVVFKNGDTIEVCDTVEKFMDLISGKYANDYELVTETKVVAEYEHESVVEIKCDSCDNGATCPWKTKRTYNCSLYQPKNKCATCAHEYKEKLPDLPPLAIMPGSEEACEAVQKRLFEYGYSWISDGQKFFCTSATVLFVEVNNDKYITYLHGTLDDVIDFTKEECPQARIMTGAEFLREFPGKQ